MRNILNVDLTNINCNGVCSSACGSNCSEIILNISGLELANPYLYFVLPDSTIYESEVLEINNSEIYYELSEELINRSGTISIQLKADNYISEVITLKTVEFTSSNELVCKYSSSLNVFEYRICDSDKEDPNKTVTGDTLPIGAVIEWDSDIIPENWLLLDGQEVSREEYSDLFDLYGTKYGEGDGSTTFNLPNRKTRVPVGKDSSDSDFNKLGKTGGEKTHKLTVSEMPSHNHEMTWNTGSGSSASAVSWISATTTQVVNTKKTGGDGAHNNLQPYIVTNFIVKAKQSAGVVATVIDNLESISEIDALSANQGRVLNDLKLDISSNLTNVEIEELINNIVL